MWSGGLVLLLAELSGASAVVETSGLGDPSWEDHAFKEALGALTPRLVIDVHAMVDTDPVVEIGTGLDDGAPMPVIASRLVSALDDQGIRTRVDDRFPARREHTVVQWARRAGIDALQIEVSTRLVPPFVSEPEAQRFIGAMSRFIARA